MKRSVLSLALLSVLFAQVTTTWAQSPVLPTSAASVAKQIDQVTARIKHTNATNIEIMRQASEVLRLQRERIAELEVMVQIQSGVIARQSEVIRHMQEASEHVPVYVVNPAHP